MARRDSSMAEYAIGVDIGGTSVKMGLFTKEATLVHTWEIPTRTESDGAFILPDIADSIHRILDEQKITKDSVLGIGIGVPGPVLSDGTVNRCVNLGWGVFSVKNELEKLTDIHVLVGNDANVAALGEMWQGGAKGYSNVVMVTLGTSVGGGIVLDGTLLCGDNGAAGEIGHLIMDPTEEEACTCGNCGCLSQYASANGIAHMTSRYLQRHPDETSELRFISPLTSKDIFEKAQKKDAVAIKMVHQCCDILGRGLAMISCVIDAEIFLLGGGMAAAGKPLLTETQTAYKNYAFHASKQTQFALATLGNEAGIYGGAKMVLSKFETEPNVS